MAIARPPTLRILLDLPADRLAPILGAWREPALLEGGGCGWNVLAAEPRLVFEATGSEWTVRGAGLDAGGAGDVLAPLATLLDRFRLADPADAPESGLPGFRGGLIGAFGYDLAPRLERLPRQAARDSRLPDVRFGLYDTFATLDGPTGLATLEAVDLLEEGGAALEDRLERWRARIGDGPQAPATTRLWGPPTSNFTRNAYLDAARRALEYIRAGDAFQVNLSQRFAAQGEIDALDLYLRLKRVSPSPFGAFLRWGDLAIVSASPESFIETRGDRVVTRPIKGTRPRGATAAEDAGLADALRASAKDRAELTMIVDLERNDLGRVCRYGSVRVTEALAVETFAQVHHLVATVEGRLRPGAGPIDLLRAAFPGGSITGAPKIRAMQIIDELEPTRRSVYTGAVGYFSREGVSAFNIAIRTLLAEGHRVSYQVGGGIVAYSDPEAEFEETLHKGRGPRAVLEGEGAA